MRGPSPTASPSRPPLVSTPPSAPTPTIPGRGLLLWVCGALAALPLSIGLCTGVALLISSVYRDVPEVAETLGAQAVVAASFAALGTAGAAAWWGLLMRRPWWARALGGLALVIGPLGWAIYLAVRA